MDWLLFLFLKLFQCGIKYLVVSFQLIQLVLYKVYLEIVLLL